MSEDVGISYKLLDDPLVFSAARRNHVPVEVWIIQADQQNSRVTVHCEECRQYWPCVTRRRIRELQQREAEASKRDPVIIEQQRPF